MSVKTSIHDILNPSTFWVGSSCYRVLTPDCNNMGFNYAEEDAYSDEEEDYSNECGVDNISEYDVQKTANGKFETCFHVASSYHKYLIGAKGATKKRLEQESGCSINIPARGVVGDVVVSSKKASKVRAGRLKIEMLVQQARRKLPPTHYIEFALSTPDVQQKFIQFKEKSLEICSGGSRGLVDGVFHKPVALHLTLGVLTLVDEYERVAAIEALTEGVKVACGRHCAEGSFTFCIKGLEYMNDDPSEVAVLYARVEDSNAKEPEALQAFADLLVENLEDAGMMMKTHDREKVKLHVTLMNTKFLKRGDAAEKEVMEQGQKDTFDARSIFEQFKNFDFGQVTVDSVRLCIRHAKDDSATKVFPLHYQKSS